MSRRPWPPRLLHGARDALFAFAYHAGMLKLYRRRYGPRRVVVTYHNVLPSEVLDGGHVFRVDMDAATFERQVAYMARSWPLLPASELAGEGEGVLLTFDDGMLNNYTTVAPILERHGVTGVFAACPALADGEVPHLWRDHLYLILRRHAGGALRLPLDDYASAVPVDDVDLLGERLKRWVLRRGVVDVYGMVREVCARNGIPYERMDFLPERFAPASWEMLRDLEARGHVVVSHTWSHRILRLLPPGEREMELVRSRERLEAELGHPVDCLMYPFGGPAEVDAETTRQARDCGYTRAYVNVSRMAEGAAGMALPRFTLPPTDSAAHLSAVLSGAKSALLRR